eukprot:12493077-Alexandrium_andersonii.AAC.1
MLVNKFLQWTQLLHDRAGRPLQGFEMPANPQIGINVGMVRFVQPSEGDSVTHLEMEGSGQ